MSKIIKQTYIISQTESSNSNSLIIT